MNGLSAYVLIAIVVAGAMVAPSIVEIILG